MEGNRLYIRITETLLIFVSTHEGSSKIEYFVFKRLPNRSLAADVRESLLRLPFAEECYAHEVRVIVDVPAIVTALDTLEQTDEEIALDAIYRYNFPTSEKDCKILFDALPHLNLAVIFGIRRDVYHEAAEVFSQLRFENAQTALLSHFARLQTARHDDDCCLYVLYNGKKTNVCLTAFKGERFLATGTYGVTQPSDVLYYSLAMLNALSIAPTATHVRILPAHAGAEALSSCIETYFESVSISQTEQLLGRNGKSLQEAGFTYDLAVRLLAESHL